MARVFHLADLDSLPLPAECLRHARVRLTKGRAKVGVGVDACLLLNRPIKQLMAHFVRSEEKRVAQVKLDLGGLTARLGNPAALDERIGIAQQLAMRGRLITASLDREPGDRPPAFAE